MFWDLQINIFVCLSFKGFLRVFEAMPDIVIDVPFAYDLLDSIKNKAETMGFFPVELATQMPAR